MTDHPLNRYLKKSKASIQDSSIDLLVMGNEAADLDSMASAIAYAHVLTCAQKDKTIVPVMPIPRKEFRLRTEAVYLFDQARIDKKNIVFLDDVDLENLLHRVKELVLVDHNRLPAKYQNHGHRVTHILDHHRDEDIYPNAGKKIIAPVGSCATLVGEELMVLCPDLLDPHLSLLLLGTILLDTINLDPAAGRVTTRDEKIASTLMTTCPMNRQTLFKKLQKAKFTTVNLTTRDLLVKDYKEIKFTTTQCGIASVPVGLNQWGGRDTTLSQGFESYAKERSLDLLISMNAYSDEGFKRDLAMYSRDEDLHDTMVQCLQEKGFELTPIKLSNQTACINEKISFFTQGNPKLSRKVLIPVLIDFFKG